MDYRFLNALLFIILLHSVKTQGCIDLYVNNSVVNTSISYTGSLSDPFPDFDWAFDFIQQNCYNASTTIYIAGTKKPYSFQTQYTSNQGIVVDYPLQSLSLIGHPQNMLPTIQLIGVCLTANATGIQKISFSGISFIMASTPSSSESNFNILTEGSLSFQDVNISVTTQSSAVFLTASTNDVSFSNVYLTGTCFTDESLIQIEASYISFNNVAISHLNMSSCGQSVISISQGDELQLTNIVSQSLNLGCSLLNIESVTLIQIQNWTANNIFANPWGVAIIVAINYGVSAENYTLEVDSLNFIANQASAGLYVAGGSSLNNLDVSISNSQFEGLSFQDAIVTIDSNMSSNTVVTNCSFGNSICSFCEGTAIYVYDGNLEVTNSIFTNNTSSDGYGGIIATLADSNITNSTFTNNFGGAIIVNADSVTITNCAFTNNSGGAITTLADSNITNSTFTNNSGGAISATADSNIANCAFTNNSGGAVAVKADSITITNCAFTNNLGGAISSDADSNITNCAFTNNSGGAISSAADSTTITNCTFTNNFASFISGGAISAGADSNITDCTFTNNSVSFANGGAISINSGSITITNCAFTNNSASYGNGDAIYSDAYSNIANCTFSDTAADAIFIAAYSNITNCTYATDAESEIQLESLRL